MKQQKGQVEFEVQTRWPAEGRVYVGGVKAEWGEFPERCRNNMRGRKGGYLGPAAFCVRVSVSPDPESTFLKGDLSFYSKMVAVRVMLGFKPGRLGREQLPRCLITKTSSSFATKQKILCPLQEKPSHGLGSPGSLAVGRGGVFLFLQIK